MLIITGYVQVDPTEVAQFLADLDSMVIAVEGSVVLVWGT